VVEKLITSFNKKSNSKQLGESWELSGVAGDISVIANGILKGKSLQNLLEAYPAELLGVKIYERFGNEFPLLIKFIDAKNDLSIQLHPGDELARESVITPLVRRKCGMLCRRIMTPT
jgi:mannose-6-phosphate isomerase